MRSHYLMHDDNNSDLMTSLAYSFTEVKVSKLGIDIVASLTLFDNIHMTVFTILTTGHLVHSSPLNLLLAST